MVIFANEGGGFIGPDKHLWDAIRSLEERTERNEKIIEKIKMRIGKKMSINFDDLLDELETPETETAETPKTPEPKVEDEFDSLLDEPQIDPTEAPEADPVASETTMDDLDNLLDGDVEEVEAIQELAEVANVDLESIVDLESLADEANIPDIPEPVITAEKPFNRNDVDFADETISYAKAMQGHEMEAQAVKNKMKDTKDEYAEVGVDIKMVDKARKEVAKELKETAQEAKELSDYKKLFYDEESYIADQVVLNG